MPRRCVGAGVHGDAEVGLRKCCGTVDAVAHHGHDSSVRLQSPHVVDLPGRQHVRDDLIDPDGGRNGPGDGGVVAGEQDRPEAQRFQPGDGVRACRLRGVGHAQHGRSGAIDGGDDRRLPGRVGNRLRAYEFLGKGDAPVREQRRATDDEGMSFDRAFHAQAVSIRKRLDPGERAEPLRCRRGDRTGDGVLRRVLDGPDQPQCLVCVDTLGCRHPHERHATGGDGAGLVQHDGVDASGRLEHLRAFDHDSELRRTAGTDEQCGGRGEPKRTRAGDDTYAYGCGEGGTGAVAVDEPGRERESGEPDHDRDEHGRHAVGETLDGRLPGLSLLHQAGHLCECRVGPDATGTDHEATADVDRGAGHRVARRDLDRHALAGQHGGIDRRRAGLDDAIRGDLLARANDEAGPDEEVMDRHEPLATGRVDDRRVLGAERQQRP